VIARSLGASVKSSFDKRHPVSSCDLPSINGDIAFSKAIQECHLEGYFQPGRPLNDPGFPTPTHSSKVKWAWCNCLDLLDFLAADEHRAKLFLAAPTHCNLELSNFYQGLQELLYNESVRMEGKVLRPVVTNKAGQKKSDGLVAGRKPRCTIAAIGHRVRTYKARICLAKQQPKARAHTMDLISLLELQVLERSGLSIPPPPSDQSSCAKYFVKK
jgi:hypothetical protein